MDKIMIFKAKNCGHCVRIAPMIKKLAEKAGIPVEVHIWDNEPELFDEYSIEALPTIIAELVEGETIVDMPRIEGARQNEEYKEFVEMVAKHNEGEVE